MSVDYSILLQKSKVASVRFFGETSKRGAIDDSYHLSRATEVTYGFSVRRLRSLRYLHDLGFSVHTGSIYAWPVVLISENGEFNRGWSRGGSA